MDPGILLRAKTYPYRIPGRSYLVEADGHRELAGDGDFPDLDGRRPVLALRLQPVAPAVGALSVPTR